MYQNPNVPPSYPGSNIYPSPSVGSPGIISINSGGYAAPYSGNMSYNPIGGNLAMGAQGAFIRKVYLMLTIQLLVVASMVLLSLYNFQYKLFVLNSITILAASIALIVLSLIIACCFQVVRPIQVPVYIVFTLLEGLVVSSITARYPSGLVAMAAIMTTLLVIILTIYAFTSNTDFTGCGPYLTIALVVMLLFGIVTIFFRFPMLQVVYSALIVLLYGFYLIYDTQLISGRFGTFYSLDDYFLASLSLFLDIMQLFLNILNIAGR